jgi:hypothetical protein
MAEYGATVAARFRDGRVVKGITSDFRPGRTFFHVSSGDGTKSERIYVEDLKALFFVKSFEGDPHRRDRKSFGHHRNSGRRVWIRFRDGEVFTGWTFSYTTDKDGFFLFPTDAASNIEKAFVVNEYIDEILHDEAAEKAAAIEESEGGPRTRRITPVTWEEMLEPYPDRRDPSPEGSSPADRDALRNKRHSSRDSNLFLGDW